MIGTERSFILSLPGNKLATFAIKYYHKTPIGAKREK